MCDNQHRCTEMQMNYYYIYLQGCRIYTILKHIPIYCIFRHIYCTFR